MTTIVDALVISIVVRDVDIHIGLYLNDALIGLGLQHHIDEFVRLVWFTIKDFLQERWA